MALGDSRRDVTVRLRAETAAYKAQMRSAAAETKRAAREADGLDTSAGKMGKQIDTLSGRVGLAADALATIGPAAVPIAGIAVPAVIGLGTQMGFAALAGGTMVAAFQGVGTALTAVNKAALDPTTQNIAAANEAMAAISPTAQAFVQKLRQLTPELKALRDTSAAGFFPGATEGLDSLVKLMPTAQRIVGAMAGELGDIAADSGASLASGRWEDFFRFLETEGPRSLRQLADAAGNTGHAVAEMLVAFAPESAKVGDYLVEETGKLDQAASRLRESDGFANFLDYVNTEGPQVAATFGAIGNAAVQVVQATAPLGGPALRAIEGIANGFAALAGSDLGTPIFAGIAALRAYSLAATAAEKASSAFQRSSTGGGAVGSAVGTYQAQVSAVRQIPAAYARAAAAQTALGEAQSRANRVTGEYTGRLQAVNQLTARGVPVSMQQLGRLGDSLSKVELANVDVADATRRASAAEAERSATVRAGAIGIGKTAAGVAALAVASSGLGDKLGVSNTLTLGLAGSMAGPLGAGLGAAAGAMIDLSKAGDGVKQSLSGIKAAIGTGDIDLLTQRLKEAKAARDDLANSTSFGDLLSDKIKDIGLVFSGNGDISAKLRAEMFKVRTELDSIKGPATGVGTLLTQGLGAGARAAGAEMDYLNQSVVQFRSSLKSLSGELDQQQALIAFRDALRGIRDTVDQNPLGDKLAAGLGKAGVQGDAVRKSLLGAAQAAVQVANGMSDADAKPYLASARKQIIGMARDLGLPMGAVRRLLAGFGELDGKTPNLNVKTNAKGVVLDFDRVKKLMTTLPPTVQTAIATPGAVKSVADVRALAKQYLRTPKQVRTLAQLAGVPLTRGQLRSITADMNKLNGKRAKPGASLNDKASAPIAKVDRSLGGLARKNPRPTVTLNDQASGKIASVAARLGALNGTVAYTTAVTILKTTKGSADGGTILPGMAGGGEVAGQRLPYGDKVIARVVGGGEIALAPGEEIITNRNGEADRFRADRAAGRIPAYADGGRIGLAAGGSVPTGITVLFPAPSVLAASVKAAEQVATSAAQTARSAKDIREANLDDLRSRQQIRDLEAELDKKQKIRVRGRDGKDDDKRKKGKQDRYKYVTRDAVRGLDREVKLAELAAAKKDLADARDAIRATAAAELAAKRAEATTTLSNTGDIFARGTGGASAVASVNKQIAAVTTYGQTVARLKAAGASPALLQQVINKGEGQGDFLSANRLGAALLAQPATLKQLNASLSTLGAVSSNVATLTTDPRLLQSKAWNPMSTVAKSVEVTVNVKADPSTWTSEIARTVQHQVTAAVVGN